jgi:ribokinase
VRTKRISEPAAPDDGTRVLVMRLWPRGARKSVADQWLKGLGTPVELIRQWKAGRIPWVTFASAYWKEIP